MHVAADKLRNCTHLLLSLSMSGEDLDGIGEAGELPDMIVHLATSGDWPKEIRGVPVKAIFDLIDAGAVTDRSFDNMVAWAQRAVEATGANGVPLGALRSRSGFPLWWCTDSHVPYILWLRIRAIEAVIDLIKHLSPRQVIVWGENRDHHWLRATVSDVLDRWAAQHPNRQVIACPSWKATLAEIRHHWLGTGLHPTDIWIPSRDIHQLSGDFTGHGQPNATAHAFVTTGSQSVFRLSREANAVAATVRWRRGEGFGLVMELDNGRWQQRVQIADGAIKFETGEMCATDTSLSHRYLLVLGAGRARLFLDDWPILEAPCNSGKTPTVAWGNLNATDITEGEWSEVVIFGPGTNQGCDFRTWLVTHLPRFVSDRLLVGKDPILKFERPKTYEPMLAPSSLGSLTLPSQLTAAPRMGDVVTIGWGGDMGFHMDGDNPMPSDPNAENIGTAIDASGMRSSFLSIGSPHPRITAAFKDAKSIHELRSFTPQASTYDDALKELQETWRSWRGSAPHIARLPDYDGFAMDDMAGPYIESILPDLATWIRDREALVAFVDKHKPSAVIFSNFVSSHRHLIEPLRARGVGTIATTIGTHFQSRLFYGQEGAEPLCPRADAYLVWGEHQKGWLSATIPSLRVYAPGRTRHDTLVRLAHTKPTQNWLQQIGLPARVQRIIVFGEVLKGTLRENVLTSATWTAVVQALIAAVADRPEIDIVVKPWLGDNLSEVRAAAAAINSPRLHVFDPNASPFHNGELLAHAVTVVSSPTSFLAEFAAMGGVPILLSLPETRYYYGNKAHEDYAQMSHAVRDINELDKAVRDLIVHPGTLTPAAADRERVLSSYFGPPDGCSAERFANAVQQVIGGHQS